MPSRQQRRAPWPAGPGVGCHPAPLRQLRREARRLWGWRPVSRLRRYLARPTEHALHSTSAFTRVHVIAGAVFLRTVAAASPAVHDDAMSGTPGETQPGDLVR